MSQYSILRARLTRIQDSLERLYDIRDEMASTGAQSYAFDSGEGSQRTTRRTYKEIQDMIESLESQEIQIDNQLNGIANVSLRLRRKPC